jgi:tripartite-type tricarboxylate transporter receptor subunit TctC
MAYFDADLVKQVKSCDNGADVHTRNKAVCYYCWLKLNPEVRQELESMMRKALASGDWQPLRIRMRRWF